MSADEKVRSSPKKARPDTTSVEGAKPPVKRSARTAQLAPVNSYSARSANQGEQSSEILARYKKLLDRQAALIKLLEVHGVSDPRQLPLSNPEIIPRPKKRLSKSEVQEIAKGVGIWTPSGKLSASYKK
jgi:hypothetical protein